MTYMSKLGARAKRALIYTHRSWYAVAQLSMNSFTSSACILCSYHISHIYHVRQHRNEIKKRAYRICKHKALCARAKWSLIYTQRSCNIARVKHHALLSVTTNVRRRALHKCLRPECHWTNWAKFFCERHQWHITDRQMEWLVVPVTVFAWEFFSSNFSVWTFITGTVLNEILPTLEIKCVPSIHEFFKKKFSAKRQQLYELCRIQWHAPVCLLVRGSYFKK